MNGRQRTKRTWRVRFEFNRLACWIGVRWARQMFADWSHEPSTHWLDVWICLVPMIPLHITRVDVYPPVAPMKPATKPAKGGAK